MHACVLLLFWQIELLNVHIETKTENSTTCPWTSSCNDPNRWYLGRDLWFE